MTARKLFADSVTTLPDQPGTTDRGLIVQAAEPENQNESMTVLFSLEIPAEDQAELEQRVARGEVIPVDELHSKYTPVAAERNTLLKWLEGQHFDVVEVSQDGTSVYARTTVGQLEKSLDVDMVRVTKDCVTYTAAKNAPSLPADIGKGVHAIIGLQPFRQMYKNFRKFMPKDGNRVGTLAPTHAAAHPSTNIRNAPPY